MTLFSPSGQAAITALVMVLLAHCIFCFRVCLVGHIRNRAIDIVYGRPDWIVAHRIFSHGPSYDAMVFDLRKWTFKQFYPTL